MDFQLAVTILFHADIKHGQYSSWFYIPCDDFFVSAWRNLGEIVLVGGGNKILCVESQCNVTFLLIFPFICRTNYHR